MNLLVKLLVKISCVVGYHSWSYYWGEKTTCPNKFIISTLSIVNGKDGATRYCRDCHKKPKRIVRRGLYNGYDEVRWVPTELSIQEKRDKNLSDILES